ncbi:hypothetical protein Scep_027412 [Stephania cephalantha]|uniref:Uncharacterized protein n=1 Tax=Stephania cephalantha TaxID=152367 RepID=A0AAP0E7W4_9MAGN
MDIENDPHSQRFCFDCACSLMRLTLILPQLCLGPRDINANMIAPTATLRTARPKGTCRRSGNS